MIPLSVPNFEGNERKYVDDAVDQGWVSTGGAYITQLEKQMADFLHVADVVACQSGTSALHMALIECDVKPGDMVIVPALTFIAAVNPVKYLFANPVFMDCDDSLCIDPNKLREFCENECELTRFDDGKIRLVHKDSEAAIKAVVVVHVFGNMADMDAIMDISEEFHLKVIEDATEALGTHYLSGKYKGKYAGTIGDFGAYSFNGNKIITTGGGGAVVAKESGETAHLRYLSTQAKDDPHFYVHNEVGYNYRMTNVQAAIGVAQMEELPDFIRRKQENYELYKQLFNGFALGGIMPFREGTSSNKWFYSVEIDSNKVRANMRDIITALHDKGIETRAIWGLINEQLPYQREVAYKIEKAPYYAERILNIPSSTQIKKEEIVKVVECVKTVLEEFAK